MGDAAAPLAMPRDERQSLPITLGAFFREFFAVALILTLQQRVWAYDPFAPGLVLFLLLIALRIPYINTFAVLFEWLAMGDWEIAHHVGLHRHRTPMQNTAHVAAIMAAHASASVCAAALRVYLDVTFGKELGGPGPMLLQVRPAELQAADPFWGAQPRLDRLQRQGLNATMVAALPLRAGMDLGIDRLSLLAWYVGEEAAFVFLLCVCFTCIWLASGVADRATAPNNPFAPAYWSKLFRMCGLLAVIYAALFRAFPSAHGSLHVTIFKCQYQAWSPTARLVDTDNYEPTARVIGGFAGLLLAWMYNQALVGTEAVDDHDDSSGFAFRMVWGMEPDSTHTKRKRLRGGEDGGHSGSHAHWPRILPHGSDHPKARPPHLVHSRTGAVRMCPCDVVCVPVKSHQ